jgi:hypothetical protein
MPDMKEKPNAEFNAFTDLVDRVLAVSREELDRREKEYRQGVDQNPKRRGPKRKPKTSADGHESAGKV